MSAIRIGRSPDYASLHPGYISAKAKHLAFAFDTLGYAKHLREAGVQSQIAEAQAEAARNFIMVELATKSDLLILRQDLLALKQHDLPALRHELQVAMENMALRITLGLGTIVVAGVAVLATLQSL